MIAQEKRIRMMFLRPKPGISTNAHKCHLSGRAFSKFFTLTPYLFVWLTTSPFHHSDFYSFVPHTRTLSFLFLSFFFFSSLPLRSPHSSSSFPFSFLFLLSLLPCSSTRFPLPFSFSSIFFLSSSLSRTHSRLQICREDTARKRSRRRRRRRKGFQSCTFGEVKILGFSFHFHFTH